MRVEFKILEEVLPIIFQHLNELDIKEIDLDKDFYWNIPEDKKYTPYEQPTDFDLGQLTEDFKELLAIQNKKSPPSGHALIALAALLRFIGEKKPM